ncbi:EOGT [Symbiodinium natans]|uniref:EOGT protein n=1 Tax=Symbiodinium natans TaxID=878477 RepID=A0A812IFI8_9DINO|nr:EOGT [Symbiodinium natans]
MPEGDCDQPGLLQLLASKDRASLGAESAAASMFVRNFLSFVQGPSFDNRSGDAFQDSLGALAEFDKHISSNCSEIYGKSMIQKTRETSHTVCKGKSSVVCHERVPFDIPRYFCELQNVQIGEDSTRVESCEVTAWAREATWGWCEKPFLEELQSQDLPLACNLTTSRKALLQMPWDTRNLYEWLGDWVTLWETLAILDWNPKDVDIFLNIEPGSMKSRPFDDAWQHAFSSEAVHVGTRKDLFGQGACFSHLATVPHGGLSTPTFNGGRGGLVSCASPTLMSSAVFLERIFPSVKPPGDLTLTLILRTGSRGFEDEDEAVQAVTKALLPGWSLRTYRPETLKTLNEQIAVAQSTQVLVGAHGAGMTHALFLPPHARVVEIWCGDRGSENHHFRNLEVLSDESAAHAPEQFHFGISALRCGVDENAVKAMKAAMTAYQKDQAM